jgi:hypothetical protein
MDFKFDSVEQEKKDIQLASVKIKDWAKNMVCSNCGTLRSTDVHYKFNWYKLGVKEYKATITEQGTMYTLYASTRKGLKYLFAEFIEHLLAKLTDSKDVERIEYSHNVTPTDLTSYSNKEAYYLLAGNNIVKQALQTCTDVEICKVLDLTAKLTTKQREYILKKLDVQEATTTDVQEATTTDVQEATTEAAAESVEFVDVIYLSAYDIKLYLHARNYEVASYRVERNRVHLGYVFYNLPTGTIRSVRGVQPSEIKYIPLNIINVLRNREHASTDVQDIQDISFTFRVIPCTIRNTYRLYITATGNNDVQEFLLAETDKQNNDTFICNVSTCLDIIKKIHNFYSEQMQYNNILEKLWFEVCEFIKGTRAHLDNYKEGTNYYLALYSSDQQITSLLEHKRVDVLFIEYFINNLRVDIVALFPDIVTPNGYIQSYSTIGQHSEAHTDLLHCKHLELNKYKDLLMELILLGYNLRVLNRN